MSYKTDFNTVYHNNVDISTNKKGGAYSAPTSMFVPSLKRNVILLSACTVAVSKSVIHKAHNETISKCRFAEKPCALNSPRINTYKIGSDFKFREQIANGFCERIDNSQIGFCVCVKDFYLIKLKNQLFVRDFGI